MTMLECYDPETQDDNHNSSSSSISSNDNTNDNKKNKNILAKIGWMLQEVASLRRLKLTPGYRQRRTDIDDDEFLDSYFMTSSLPKQDSGVISRSFEELDVVWTAMEEWDQITQSFDDAADTIAQYLQEDDNNNNKKTPKIVIDEETIMTSKSSTTDYEVCQIVDIMFEDIVVELKEISTIEGCTSVGPLASVPNFVAIQSSLLTATEKLASCVGSLSIVLDVGREWDNNENVSSTTTTTARIVQRLVSRLIDASNLIDSLIESI